jgi:hypothetical protein
MGNLIIDDSADDESIVYTLRVKIMSSPDYLADAWGEFADGLEHIATEIRQGNSAGAGWDIESNHPELTG